VSLDLVQHCGAQREIFATGKAGRAISIADLPCGDALLHALGPCQDLDGEITVLRGEPYVSKVRGGDYIVDRGTGHGAIFLVWTRQAKWREAAVPASVTTYVELQSFIRNEAEQCGIDISGAFPFLLSGTPTQIRWHINVDRTGGKPVTRELFQQSKQSYVLRGEPVEIIGFYSERHTGVFISQYAPAIDTAKGEQNFMHLHFVSRAGRATGHIDDLRLEGPATLRLPAR